MARALTVPMPRALSVRWIRVLTPYAYLAPAMIAIGVLILYPIGRAIYLSFHALDLMRPMEGIRFVGLQHFVRMANDAAFWRSLWITLIYTAAMAVGAFGLGLVMALLLNLKFRFRVFARVLVVLPWAISPAVASLIWLWMLDQDFGVVNYVLIQLGVVSTKVGWLTGGVAALTSVTLVTIWKFTPIATVMLLAALQTIPRDLYEAARIDGARTLQQFAYVTLPAIKPVSALLFCLLVLWGFRRFEFIFIMTQGGPAGATETLIVKTYQEAFRYWDIGYASALGTFSLAIALLFSLGYLRLIFRQEGGI